MCLAQGPQHSDACKARTRSPSVSSQAHCAPIKFTEGEQQMYVLFRKHEPWSECMNMQAGLRICCSHATESGCLPLRIIITQTCEPIFFYFHFYWINLFSVMKTFTGWHILLAHGLAADDIFKFVASLNTQIRLEISCGLFVGNFYLHAITCHQLI